MEKEKYTLKRLTELCEDEWIVAIEKCRRLIDLRVRGRTKFGCHSENYLGMSPFDYYIYEAINKLYSGAWEWKEEYSISEQMCRIVGSLISENVRKYRLEQEKNSSSIKTQIPIENIGFFNMVDFDEDTQSAEKEKFYEYQIDTIMEAIDGNEDMETLFLYITEGKSSDEICNETGWEKKKLYRVTDHLKSKVKNYIIKHSKETT